LQKKQFFIAKKDPRDYLIHIKTTGESSMKKLPLLFMLFAAAMAPLAAADKNDDAASTETKGKARGDKKKDSKVSPVPGLTPVRAADLKRDTERRMRAAFNAIEHEYGVLRERLNRADVEKNPDRQGRADKLKARMKALSDRVESAADSVAEGLTGEAAEAAKLMVMQTKLEYLKQLETGKNLSAVDKAEITKAVAAAKGGPAKDGEAKNTETAPGKESGTE